MGYYNPYTQEWTDDDELQSDTDYEQDLSGIGNTPLMESFRNYMADKAEPAVDAVTDYAVENALPIATAAMTAKDLYDIGQYGMAMASAVAPVIASNYGLRATPTLKLFHGGASGTDVTKIDPYRLAEKQNKRGRNYAGYYMTPNVAEAQRYANQANNGSTYEISMPYDSKIKDLDRYMQIVRLKPEELQDWRNEGYDMLSGKNQFGKREYVLLNPDKITNYSER